MRKSLFFFLWCVLGIITSAQGKNTDISNNPVKDTVGFREMKKPLVQSRVVSVDSLKINAKDTIHYKRHRLIAALLAFPLGVFGLHRIYLGTSPQVPFIYIVTIGGAFGILPFIDFVMILLSKNKDFHSTYTGNHHLFMWQKK